MALQHAHDDIPGSRPPFWKSKFGVAFIMLALVALFYLIREHWNHIGGGWLYLLLLMCPLMHLFGHGGHGGHRHDSTRKPSNDQR